METARPAHSRHVTFATPLGPAHLALAGGDVITWAVVCRSDALAKSAFASLFTSLAAGSFDFRPAMAVEPFDPFTPGVAVIATYHDADVGAVDVEGKIVSVVDDDVRMVRSKSGVSAHVHVRDLRLREAS